MRVSWSKINSSKYYLKMALIDYEEQLQYNFVQKQPNVKNSFLCLSFTDFFSQTGLSLLMKDLRPSCCQNWYIERVYPRKPCEMSPPIWNFSNWHCLQKAFKAEIDEDEHKFFKIQPLKRTILYYILEWHSSSSWIFVGIRNCFWHD